MKKYIITISIAVLAVIGIGVGLGIGLKRKPYEFSTYEKQPYVYWTDAEHPFRPFTTYYKHIQHPTTPFVPSATTEAEKHYQDLLDAGHQDVDDRNQLKYNY